MRSDGVGHEADADGFDDAGLSAVLGEAGDELAELEVRVHAGVGVDVEVAEVFDGVLGVALVAGEGVGQ